MFWPVAVELTNQVCWDETSSGKRMRIVVNLFFILKYINKAV